VTVEPMADGKYNFFARFETAAGIVGDPVAIGIPFMNNTAMAIPDTGTINSEIMIDPAFMSVISDLNVTINITHPRDEDLDIFLVAPNGTEIELSTDNGGFGANYTNTTFDDAAGLSITAGVAPFTGTFRPEEILSQLNGLPIGGTWTLRITDDSMNEQQGTLVNWTLSFQTPLMVVIDTVEPNTPYLDLLEDTGRSNVDNITKDNTPMVSMTTTDPNVAFSQLLFTDNFKFRIYDRFQNSAQEVLIYDSAQDTNADNFMTPNDMFTALTQITRTLPVLTPVNPAITAGGELSDGVHNLKLEVEDRAGNISHDFLLTITVDTTAPPVSFGLPTVASAIDGLAASSDTGVTTVPATFADRISSDTTPTLWGRAEADSIVRVYLDRDYDGIIDLNTDTFLGQTVAVPYDGNDAYPDGYWELTSALDLNQLFVSAGLEKDGLRRLLVTAEDVAGNPMPMLGVGGNPNAPGIATNVDELHIFIDTQGPQVTDVSINNLTSREYDLFDPKPSENGPTPLVNSITIHFRDLPSRVQALLAANSFLYPALVNNNGIAAVVGNYLLVGDHVGIIPIESVVVNNEIPADYTFNGTLTLVTSTSVIRDSNLVGAIEQPVVGDYILINNGAAAGQVRRIVAYNSALGQMTLDVPLLNLPIAGNSYTITTFAEATVVLDFYTPLPDDRYTLTVSDNLVDPANNKLDGESNADEPQEIPTFPSGDGVPGGSFVARFTLDSRPEIGSFVSQAINIDINGNFVWDPANAQIGNDATNVDLSFTMSAFENGSAIPGDQSPHELLVAGKFTAIGTNSPGARFFDQMATYGNYNGVFRWLIDLDSDGVVYGNGDPDGVNDLIINQGTAAGFNSTARAGAIPVAGDFDRNSANGDEIGLYYSGTWFLDTNHDYVLDRIFTGNLAGAPIVGDFDGNGFDDLAVFNSNQFFFDLTFNPLADTTANSNTSIVWGFPGVLDRPVAADMDQDGIDDIGLWVPRDSANPPRIVAEWYFLVSGTFSAATRIANYGTVNLLKHPFSPVPFGTDLYAEFGDELAMPIVGNFDPPVAASAVQSTQLAGDYDHNNRVDQADYAVWKSNFGSQANLDADGNGDGVVNSADYSIWRNNLGAQAAGSGSGGSAGGSVAESAVENVAESVVESVIVSTVVSVEPIVFYAADAPRIEFAEPAASTFDTVAPSQVEDLSLLLAVSHAPATGVDNALEEFGAGSSSDTDSDVPVNLDEVAVAAAWQAWDEL
jgi:subtilisin-like proprotein convertase family protein